MKISEFMTNYSIKKYETVKKWILDDMIPGAILSSDYVPDSARPPYTKARAKDAYSIYHSIVVASSKRYHVMPKLYKICQEEFDTYVDNLIKAGLISRRKSDNIEYYDATVNSKGITKKSVIEALLMVIPSLCKVASMCF